jgi:cystathionine gamma-synthase
MVQLFAGIHEVTFVDMSNLEAVKNAIRPNTALFWVESPSNPLLKITDIRQISALAKAQGALLACDNTFATPVFQNPIDLGADIVMHSSTKYFGGHSDILGGALVTSKKDAFWEKIRNVQRIGGAVPSPTDCYYLTRSIRTLAYRMKGHATTTRGRSRAVIRQPLSVRRIAGDHGSRGELAHADRAGSLDREPCEPYQWITE